MLRANDTLEAAHLLQPIFGSEATRISPYMLTAVITSLDTYSNEELVAWITADKPVSSHRCRRVGSKLILAFTGGEWPNPDVFEHHACYAPGHTLLEDQCENNDRIGCLGGDRCLHDPKCFSLFMPEAGAWINDVDAAE